MRRRLPNPWILVCVPLLLNGCTSTDPRISGNPGPSTETGLSTRVAIVPPGFTSPFHVALKDGAVEAASQIGWKVDVVAAESEGDFAGQVAVVEQELQRGISAIAINQTAVERALTASRAGFGPDRIVLVVSISEA